VALFEIGADTTSLKVLRDDEMLYDRDQAFGGSQLTSADLAPVRPLVRGGRAEEAGRRPARRLRIPC
jgi:Ethanolamine utilization protein EutJ (predicted chaperonin)